MLAEPVKGIKIIPKSFVSISHLPGSRLVDSYDKYLENDSISLFIDDKKMIKGYSNLESYRRDCKVFITEKVDGANVSVYKDLDKKIYPLIRVGYDVRTCSDNYKIIREFGRYVEERLDLFEKLLNPGERLCGEWMAKEHSLHYDIPGEPFIPFDLIFGIGNDMIHKPYLQFLELMDKFNLVPTKCISDKAMKPEEAYLLLGEHGFHGCAEKPEGIVYRYEVKGKFKMFAKYVANPNIGKDFEKRINDHSLLNTWTGKFQIL